MQEKNVAVGNSEPRNADEPTIHSCADKGRSSRSVLLERGSKTRAVAADREVKKSGHIGRIRGGRQDQRAVHTIMI